MKRVLFLFALMLAMPALSTAQEAKQYYIYNTVQFEGTLRTKGFNVKVDNGKTIDRLRDDKGKSIEFTTPAGALMYFISKGWEPFSYKTTTEGEVIQGTGSTTLNSYWILRKPCTKEEFDKAVKEAVKKDKSTH